MIQISPQNYQQVITELTQAPPESQRVQERETESAQKLKPEKNGLGVFAKILAGLRGGKTGAAANTTGVSAHTPLAEATEPDELKPVSKAKKSEGSVKISEKAEAKKPRKTGETEPELIRFELSEQEKNLLLGVSRLTGQPEDKPVSESAAADSTRKIRDQVQVEAVLPEENPVELTEKDGKNLSTGVSAAFGAEETEKNQKTISEKTKTRLNTAEITEKTGQTTGETANQELVQRAEAKTAVFNEKDGKNRLEEARNRKRNPVIEVHDSRSAELASKDNTVQIKTGAETRVNGEGTTKEITLELHLPNQGQETPSATTSWEVKAGQAFDDLLARELHQNFNNDIVRHASVMLRDGNEGTIRLALKPESLGNVKIRLEMAENKITGHIIVESEEALKAFEREILSLEKAFLESGFEGANLEMSLAADGRGAQQETEASRFLPWQYAASRYDASFESMELPLTLDFYRQGTMAVNLLA